jgi:hypothetical protein
MSTPPPPAAGYASIQSSGVSYKASSIKEGFICAGVSTADARWFFDRCAQLSCTLARNWMALSADFLDYLPEMNERGLVLPKIHL